MIQLQYDFFKTEEQQELETLKNFVQDVKVSNDRVRKKLFADHGNSRKLLLEIDERLRIIEKYICKT